MNDDTSVESIKWVQLQQCLKKSVSVNRPNDYLAAQRWFFDNGLVFFIQVVGYSLNQYLLGPTLVSMTSGVALALLFLKGNAILPGLALSACLSQLVTQHNLPRACLYTLFQVMPLWLFKVTVNRYMGATLVSYSLRARTLNYSGLALISVIIPFGLSGHRTAGLFLTSALSEFNGLLVMSQAVLMFDLYLVDWCEMPKSSLNKLCWLLSIWLLFIVGVLYGVQFTWVMACLFLVSFFLLYQLSKLPFFLGLMSGLVLFAFLQVVIGLFVHYTLLERLGLQCLLLLNTLYALYLVGAKNFD